MSPAISFLNRCAAPPAGGLERALVAGLQSRPRRLADPLFLELRGHWRSEALAQSERSLALSHEAPLLSSLASPSGGGGESLVLVGLEAGQGGRIATLGQALGAERIVLAGLTEVRLRSLAEGMEPPPPGGFVEGVLGDLRDGVRHLRLDVQGKRAVAWLGAAINRRDPAVAEHLLRHVGQTLVPGPGLFIGIESGDDPDAFHARHRPDSEALRAHALSVLDAIEAAGSPIGSRDPFQAGVRRAGDAHLIITIQSEEPVKIHLASVGFTDTIEPGEEIEVAHVHAWSRHTLEETVGRAGLALKSCEEEGGYLVARIDR